MSSISRNFSCKLYYFYNTIHMVFSEVKSSTNVHQCINNHFVKQFVHTVNCSIISYNSILVSLHKN